MAAKNSGITKTYIIAALKPMILIPAKINQILSNYTPNQTLGPKRSNETIIAITQSYCKMRIGNFGPNQPAQRAPTISAAPRVPNASPVKFSFIPMLIRCTDKTGSITRHAT